MKHLLALVLAFVAAIPPPHAAAPQRLSDFQRVVIADDANAVQQTPSLPWPQSVLQPFPVAQPKKRIPCNS